MGRDEQILDLLVHWEEGGRQQTPEELCPDDPQLRVELERPMNAVNRCDQEVDAIEGLSKQVLPLTLPAVARTSADALAPGTCLSACSGYLIQKVAGRGGMAVVYQATQTGTDRVVAVKTMAAGLQQLQSAHERFRREGRALGRLSHVNIVQIHDAFEVDGVPYLCLECVEKNLATCLRNLPRPVDPRVAARLTATLAAAVGTARQKDIVHRDLKTSNVLVVNAAADPAAWVLKITDFGLAKVEDESELTPSGLVGGTRAVAPGEPLKTASPAYDVYMLGNILYEMLTKEKPPVYDPNVAKPPLSLPRRTPGDLQAICQKCLQIEPKKRYSNAEELTEDLDRFLEDMPVQARDTSWKKRAGKALKRWWKRKWPLVLAAGLSAALSGMVVALVTFEFTARRAEGARRLLADEIA
jgi:serine/threonine protein kinase